MISLTQSKDGAEAYDLSSKTMQSEHFKFMMSEVDIKKGWKILDVGCGTGCDTISLLSLIGEQGELIGIDPIAERIEIANKNYQNDSTYFYVGYGKDASKFGTDYFDLVISNKVFHWIPTAEKELTFECIAQSLKPDGQFIFLIPKKDSNPGPKISKLFGLAPKNIRESANDKVFHETKEDLEQMVLNNGFDHVIIKEEQINTPFDSVDNFFQWLTSAMHIVDYAETYNTLKEIEKNNDVTFVYNENGKIDFNMDYWLVSCTKYKK